MTEWYVPDYREPFNDDDEYREWYEENLLESRPVYGPDVDNDGLESITSDKVCMAERFMDFWSLDELNLFDLATEYAINNGREISLTIGDGDDGYGEICFEPFEHLPKIPEKSYNIFGPFADMMRKRIEAADGGR